MKIDAHNHFWKFDPVRDAWITDDMAVLRKDYLPEELAKVLAENGIDGTIAVQADQSETETYFLLDLSAKHAFIKGVVGWVDLQSDQIQDRLEYFSEFPKLVGFRHIVQAEPNPAFMLGEAFQRGLGLLKDHHFTYDILIFPNQLKAAIDTVRLHPDQKFVIDHLAKPYIGKGIIEEWKTDMKVIAEYPNVCCKLSGMVTETNWENWKYEQLVPYLDVVFDCFGIDRVMFGSDWPVCLLAADYGEVKSIIDTYFSAFSSEEKNKVFGLNAANFYNLNNA
jgi:L-fuconolactonase